MTIEIILIAICFIVNIRYIVNIIDSWQETATITNYTILHIAISILIAIAIEIICFILNSYYMHSSNVFMRYSENKQKKNFYNSNSNKFYWIYWI